MWIQIIQIDVKQSTTSTSIKLLTSKRLRKIQLKLSDPIVLGKKAKINEFFNHHYFVF